MLLLLQQVFHIRKDSVSQIVKENNYTHLIINVNIKWPIIYEAFWRNLEQVLFNAINNYFYWPLLFLSFLLCHTSRKNFGFRVVCPVCAI